VARLVLMVVLGLVTAFYFPDSRAAMMDIAEPVIGPAVRWSTSAEMRQVGENVLEHERLTGKLPDRRTWLGWLDYRYSSDDMRQDPWGSMYQLRVWGDSVAVVSWGPDATSSTEDDFQVVVPRER